VSDFIDSIKAALYDRAVSPLFGTFVVAWLLCNYKVPLIIFSDMDVHGKISYIDYILYPDPWIALLPLLVFPGLATLVAIYLYPLVSRPVFQHFMNNKNRLRSIKNQSDDSIQGEKIIKLRRVNSELRIEGQREIEVRDDEIERLKKVIESHTQRSALNDVTEATEKASASQAEPEVVVEPVEVVPSPGRLTPLDPQNDFSADLLSPSQIQLLQTIVTTEPFVTTFSRASVRDRYDVNTLVKNKLIEEFRKPHSSGMTRSAYRLSSAGIEFLVKNNLA
jgi:hypothetical protein